MTTFAQPFANQWNVTYSAVDSYPSGFNAPNSWIVDNPTTSGAPILGNDFNELLDTAEGFWDNDHNASYVSSTAPSGITDYMYMRDFGFDVPTNATIVGVEVLMAIEEFTDGDIEAVRLALSAGAGTLSPQNKLPAQTSSPGVDWTINVLGGPADDWGATLTPAIVNSFDFGIVFRFDKGSSTNSRYYFRSVGMRVYYTVPSVDGEVRTSQLYAEVISRKTEPADLSHVYAEVISRTVEPADLSHLYLEVLRSVPSTAINVTKRRMIINQGDLL